MILNECGFLALAPATEWGYNRVDHLGVAQGCAVQEWHLQDHQAYQELEAQVGRGAGNIAATNFRHPTYLTDTLVEAALAMQQSLRSAWTLVELWNNGTTVWTSPGGARRATVSPDGQIRIDRIAQS